MRVIFFASVINTPFLNTLSCPDQEEEVAAADVADASAEWEVGRK